MILIFLMCVNQIYKLHDTYLQDISKWARPNSQVSHVSAVTQATGKRINVKAKSIIYNLIP